MVFETAASAKSEGRKDAMRYGYARVSRETQITDSQILALKAADCEAIFEDVITGRSRRRPGLDQLLDVVASGDTVVIWRLNRLGRSFNDLIDVARDLHTRGAILISLTEGFDTSTPFGEAAYRFLCIMADLDRANIVENTVAGLRAARARGQVLGRHRKLTSHQLEEAETLIGRGAPVAAVAHRFGVGRATLYRHRKAIPDA